MQVTLTGKQIDITPSLRNYVDSKLERVERYFDRVMSIHVILRVENLDHHAEATVSAPGGKPIFADSSAKDMYAAIDGLADKLDRQVKKQKEKLKDVHREEAAALTPQP